MPQLVNIYPFKKFGENVVFHGPRRRKEIALTFDDGPSKQTSKILNILNKNNAKGTFFVLGKNVKKYVSILGKVSKQGFEIGNHTYNHSRCIFTSKSKIKEQIMKTDYELLKLGIKTSIFRPPDGRFGFNLISVLKELNKKGIIWDTEPKDWTRPGAEKVVSRILKKVKPGSIVCLHDCTHEGKINEDLIEILQEVVPELIRRDYKLVTISELL